MEFFWNEFMREFHRNFMQFFSSKMWEFQDNFSKNFMGDWKIDFEKFDKSKGCFFFSQNHLRIITDIAAPPSSSKGVFNVLHLIPSAF